MRGMIRSGRYTVEMQMVNEHNLPFRMREYQKLMDQEILNSGDDYDKLANYPTYVIFFVATLTTTGAAWPAINLSPGQVAPQDRQQVTCGHWSFLTPRRRTTNTLLKSALFLT